MAALLVMMDRKWGDVFRLILGKNERSPVNELLAVCNPPGAKIQASGHHVAWRVVERVAR